MAGRTRTKKHVSQKTQNDAATQTSPDKNISEINRMKEDNHLLLQELRRLRRELQAKSPSQKQNKEHTVVAVADSPQQQQIPAKGCSCRGKCVSRVCGCVKKQVACTAACKCTQAKCENKDHNKENIDGLNARAQTSTELENSTKLMSMLKLAKNLAEQDTEEAAGPSNNQLEQAGVAGKSIFSPETPKILRNGQPVNNIQFNTPIRFGSLGNQSNANSKSSANRTPEQNVSKDLLKVSSKAIGYGVKKAETSKPMKKKLISPYYDGRKRRAAAFKITDIKGMDSLVEDKPVKGKAKEKNVEQVLRDTATSSSGNLEQLNGSENSDNEQLEFGAIDPMKPTRQLQRTPVSANSKKPQIRKSESPFLYQEVKVGKRSIVPPPQDIDEPQVDWDEHCAQLVPCRHCSRTFYPFRLEKHEASCKRI